jgi:hypothetical protein
VRRIATGLLVAALAALGLVAAVDALWRPGESSPQAARQTTTAPLLARQPELAVSQLREAGVSGLLTYSDEDCRLHAVSLPELRPAQAPSFEMCRPLTASGGLGAIDGEVVWSGLGYGTVQVVLSEEQLSRAIRAGLGMETAEDAGFRAVQAVSLSDERYVVLADSTYKPRERVLAGFDGTRSRFVHPSWEVGEARAVRPSPQGGYFALLGEGWVGTPIFSRDGRRLDLPQEMPNPRSITWSPDERWTAVATENSVFVFRTNTGEAGVRRLPIHAYQVAWR